MERRYGKKQLQSMINDIQAETWIGENSKPCPHCNAPIEVFQFIYSFVFKLILNDYQLIRKKMDATKCRALVAALTSVGCACRNWIRNVLIFISLDWTPNVICSKVSSTMMKTNRVLIGFTWTPILMKMISAKTNRISLTCCDVWNVCKDKKKELQLSYLVRFVAARWQIFCLSINKQFLFGVCCGIV